MAIANVTPPSDSFAFPSITMDPDKVIALTQSLVDAGITYGLGSKIEPLALQAPDLADAGIGSVDCSGFVRWCIYHATGSNVVLVDGSVDQHQQIDDAGFKQSTVADAGLDDGAIRIAFLTPEAGGGVGHVVLVTGGSTCESYGHHGPGRRVWVSEGFMSNMSVYVLTPPSS